MIFYGCSPWAEVTCGALTVPETDKMAFDNSDSQLFVPAASLSAYKVTNPWRYFKSISRIILPTYKLIYMVDGKVYKTYIIEETTAIIPEAEPTKEGCTFSGWSEIPATMPAKDVTIIGNFTFIDAIEDVNADDSTYQIYTIDGKPVEALQKGVNIIRMSDGTTKKVYVK